ncbi:hypothetical protein PV371_01030 [Streptomyces sp. TX20-6-3]|uniref:hypothetical protein n=1 Tax=Streptomyces sp. TX20-6-3 TaxID=3028705 RepID=UPI0029ABCEC3|nr:hypothetical protein [Streptomyces sp. TX20-6-3]MDX2558231.1 hypothetical protein [Streptomyces sp. TX20-6-3]
MYDIETRQRALTLLRSGAKRGESPGRCHRPPCPRCDGRDLDEAAYAYLLGLLYTDTLERVGVAWRSRRRATGAHDVSVARKASVALMDRHVGPKH